MNRQDELTVDDLKKLIDYDPDTGFFYTRKLAGNGSKKPGDKIGGKSHGYIILRINARQYLAHRVAWLYVYGSWPNLQIDHINLNRSDNRICNLRLASHADNKHNEGVRRNNRSGFKGVGWCSKTGRWRARCHLNGKTHTLGNFDTPQEASEAYNKFAMKHHGVFFRSCHE